MTAKKRQTRQYLQLAKASIEPMLGAIDAFNCVYGGYKVETTLILLTNAWELIAKAILVKKKKSIHRKSDRTQTISCEESINALFQNKDIDQNQAELLQQVVSLRNKCVHGILPSVPEAIQHHLFFFTCKFYREALLKHFPVYAIRVNKNFLTLSFEGLTTYAAQVQAAVSKLRRGTNNDKELIWLLERGIRYLDGNEYISQKSFEDLYRKKKKIIPHLKISNHSCNSDMICIIPVQAPQNFTADISLRKGGKTLKGSLPVTIKKTNIEEDYPLQNADIAIKIGKNATYTSTMIKNMGLKENPEYHQSIRVGKKSKVHRYSNKTLDALKEYLQKHPNYNPYKKEQQA